MEHLLIRADSTPKIGAGHIMRCIALAQVWQAEGGEVTFLSYCESTALRERIQAEGFHFIPVDEPHPLPGDLEQLLATATRQSKKINWVVLDGYHFDPEYQKQIRDSGLRLLVIDDMNHLAHYHADILLNQNINGPELKYSCDPDTTKLQGSRYVVLRKEFIAKAKGDQAKEIPAQATNILVCLGGADPGNVTFKVIKALQRIKNPLLMVKAIIGPSNPHYDAIKNELSQSRYGHEILQNVKDMSQVMAWADLAISSVGSTTWELLAIGVPTVLIITAQNQALVTESLSGREYCRNLGWSRELSEETISAELAELIESRTQRSSMIEKGRQLVDCLGSTRVVEEMLSAGIQLRKVTKQDCELLWKWANDPMVREMSFNTQEIPIEVHERWFAGKFSDPQCIIYIAEDDDTIPVGQVRFELEQNEANVGISVACGARNRGIGTILLKKALEQLTRHKTITAVHAWVRNENRSSFQLFKKAGFMVQNLEEETKNSTSHLVWRMAEGQS